MIDIRTGRRAPKWREDSLRRLGLAKPKRRGGRVKSRKAVLGDPPGLTLPKPLEPEPPVIEETSDGT